MLYIYIFSNCDICEYQEIHEEMGKHESNSYIDAKVEKEKNLEDQKDMEGIFDIEHSESPIKEKSTDQVLKRISNLPTRRSTRIADQLSKEVTNWPQFNPVTINCNIAHFGIGCGAYAANHMPPYYNSLYHVK